MNQELPDLYRSELPIKEFVTKRLIGIDLDSSVQEAAKKMVELNISSLAVLEDDEIVGFFTDGDIKRKVVAEGLSPEIPVKDIMETDLITADIGTSVGDVFEIMSKKDVKHILVTEGEPIVGILTFSDLIDIDRQSLDTYISRE